MDDPDSRGRHGRNQLRRDHHGSQRRDGIDTRPHARDPGREGLPDLARSEDGPGGPEETHDPVPRRDAGGPSGLAGRQPPPERFAGFVEAVGMTGLRPLEIKGMLPLFS